RPVGRLPAAAVGALPLPRTPADDEQSALPVGRDSARRGPRRVYRLAAAPGLGARGGRGPRAGGAGGGARRAPPRPSPPSGPARVLPPLPARQLPAPRPCRPGWPAWTASLAAAVGVAAPWYAAALAQEPGFLDYFFWKHNLVRFLAPFDHEEPVWFYLPGLF